MSIDHIAIISMFIPMVETDEEGVVPAGEIDLTETRVELLPDN